MVIILLIITNVAFLRSLWKEYKQEVEKEYKAEQEKDRDYYKKLD